jgi:hypothetical protein
LAEPTITVNLTVTAQGVQPTPPVALWADLITLVAGVNSGYTVLPAGLIEDLASTGTYAVAQMNAAGVETINSLVPSTANPWLLTQLGNIYGVPQGIGSNTSVYVVFSGTVRFQIPQGFIVSDGTYQYVLQEGTVIGADGFSAPAYCIASLSGSWPVAQGTVTTLVTQPPPGITLGVNNPIAGTPSAAPQTEPEYRAQVLAAGLVTGSGAASMCKTLLGNVAGVQTNLVSVKQVDGGGWEVIVGGGDPYAVAAAINASGLDISTLVGSTIGVTAATEANPAVLTTNLDHGLTTGQAGVVVAGATGMTAINGSWTVTVLSPTTFSIPVNTGAGPAYTGGGVVTPNARNVVVDLNDYPDVYSVPFVVPPAQPVTVQLTWNTDSLNFVSSAAVAQLGAPAIANYVNALYVGAPINLNSMGAAFSASILTLLGGNLDLLSELTWTVSVNGVEATPEAGTFLIPGDPESYFTCGSAAVTITKA